MHFFTDIHLLLSSLRAGNASSSESHLTRRSNLVILMELVRSVEDRLCYSPELQLDLYIEN
jgi:hypothetical protein